MRKIDKVDVFCIAAGLIVASGLEIVLKSTKEEYEEAAEKIEVVKSIGGK